MNKSQRKVGYLFLAPNLIGYVIFTLIPVIWAFVLSFTNWDGFNQMEFVGLKNYIKMASNETFQISIKNNVIYTFVSVPASIILGLVVAMMLNEKLKCLKIFRAIYLNLIKCIYAFWCIYVETILFIDTSRIIRSSSNRWM
jgi:multiple sugar transport system permease protein